MRYLVSISYDGSSYYGFERQKDKISIQGCIEDVLTKIDKNKVLIKGAGRTDRGVHAFDQKAHFDLVNSIPCNGLMNAMNSLLPSSIHINSCINVSNDFHARFNVKKKVYEYYINIGKYDAIFDTHVYNYNKNLDIIKMRNASKYLIGKHDYRLFVTGERKNYNSTIYKISISKKNNIIKLEFVGKSFYRYMVRNIVGVLILVGSGKINEDIVKNMVDCNISKINYVSAPACGLYLKNVKY